MKHVVIVDAYSTGQYLAPFFRAHNYPCIHIQSTPHIDAYYLHHYEKHQYNFVKHLVFDGNIAELVRQLQQFAIKWVFPGCEMGVLLADLLNKELGLSGCNTWELSPARRNKYLMQQALKSHQVRAIDSFQSDDLSQILHWAKSKNTFPIVVKPLASGGSDGVFFCNTLQEITLAFSQILHQRNACGDINTAVLAQEFIAGTEYVINTVSYAGKHYVTDIWRSVRAKLNHSLIYDTRELLAPHETEFAALTHYTETVLDALGIQYGAAHSEVITTADGPVLIETGARLVGAMDPCAFTEALGYSQVSLLAESVLNPDNFLRMAKLPRLALRQHLWIVYLISDIAGIMKDNVDLRELTQVAGFHSMYHSLWPGEHLVKTVDTLTSPGLIYLVAEDQHTVQQGHQQIRALEKSLYASIVRQQNFRMDHFKRLTFLPKSNADYFN